MANSDDVEDFELSELEKKARERRERLKELRKLKDAQSSNGSTSKGGGENSMWVIGRRLWQPVQGSIIIDVNEDVRSAIGNAEEQVEDIVEEAKKSKIGDTLDISIIAPKKVDWDLQRGIQDKLDQLERQTNRAIVTLVRDSLKT